MIFIGGNYIILRSMFHGSSSSNTTKKYVNSNNDPLNNGIENNILNNENKKDFIENTFDKPKNKIKLSPHIKPTEEPAAPAVINDKQDYSDAKKFKIALLVISCNRVEIRRCLDKIFQYKPKDYPIQVIVSQDCGHQQTAQVIKSYGDKLKFIQQPDLGPVHGVPHNMHRYMGYYKISRHFKFALGKVFETTDSDSVIIVEDDIDIGMKFYYIFFNIINKFDVITKGIECIRMHICSIHWNLFIE